MKIEIEIPNELVPILKSFNGNVAKYIENIVVTPLMEKYIKQENEVLLGNKVKNKAKLIRNKIKSREV